MSVIKDHAMKVAWRKVRMNERESRAFNVKD